MVCATEVVTRASGNIYRANTNFVNLQLSPWFQNPQVHRGIYNRPTSARILSQLDPLSIPPASLPKIHFDPILPSTLWSFKWTLSFGLST
jgi:hypothetical protein